MQKKSDFDIEILASTRLPTEFGLFEFSVWKSIRDHKEHTLLKKGVLTPDTSPLIRIHSACETSERFLSLKCDCREQLHNSMALIEQEGSGMIIYLHQEGRGIGLINKVKAYSLQEKGLDTLEANQELHLPIDSRDYSVAVDLLNAHNIHSLRLITNNPEKINALKKAGITISEHVSLPATLNEFNKKYLVTKKNKLGHLIMFKGQNE